MQFEIPEQTRASVEAWIKAGALASGDYLFPSRIHCSPHVSTRRYARLVVAGSDRSAAYETHTMRRSRASLIDRRTKNLRAVQLLLGHSKVECTVQHLGIEIDGALEIAEQTDV